MIEYLVTSDYGQWNNIWIVLAKDAKDAINQIWNTHIVPMNIGLKQENIEYGYKAYRLCRKEELKARSLSSLHNKQGKIISVN